MTQAACESIKLRREAATASSGRWCSATSSRATPRMTAILSGSPNPQTIESESRCANPSRAARFRAYVLFPEPELPKTSTFIWLNESTGVELGRHLVLLLLIDHRLFSRDCGIRMILWGCEAIGEFPQEWFHVCDHAD